MSSSLSHQQWEAQLSGIIERTNANLSALSSRYSPQRSARPERRLGGAPSRGASSWARDSFEEPAPPSGRRLEGALAATPRRGAAGALDDATVESIVSRVVERLGGACAPAGGGDRLRQLEEEVAQLRASTTHAVQSARGRDSAVEALGRESQNRKGASSKMMAWQADAEQWRSRVDAALEVAAGRGAEADVAVRDVAAAVKRAASRAAPRTGDSTSLRRERSARARSGARIRASEALREMSARPKISRNEGETGSDRSLSPLCRAGRARSSRACSTRRSSARRRRRRRRSRPCRRGSRASSRRSGARSRR